MRSIANSGTSFPEQVIYYYIKKFFPDAENRSTRFGFELDIYIPSLNTGVEYDGLYYHSEKLDLDNQKNLLCKKSGIRLIRVREKGLPSIENSDIATIYCDVSLGLHNAVQQVLEVLNIDISIDEINIDAEWAEIVMQKKSIHRGKSLAILYPKLLAE